jgi:cyanophycin synthetase
MPEPASTEPFRDSRRLTGCNLYFNGTGAALESAPGPTLDDTALARWRDNIAAARDALGWPAGAMYVRRHASGVSLAFEAPMDQLYAATEVGEWAFCDALGQRPNLAVDTDDGPRAHAGALPRDEALRLLASLARAEARPALRALAAAAARRGVTFLPDDDAVSIGAGEHGQVWDIAALPAVEDVDWPRLHAIPTALVTGSNGKTTVVRLLAAMLRAHGLHTAHSCTEGVYFDNALIEGGDYSGPGGARTALRHPRAQAAVLETARGGILRRGLALCAVDAAVVTNISADHYGEYGVHGLEDLAAAKLVVARAVRQGGLLVLNADDPVLRKLAPECAIGWFGTEFDDAFLAAHRQAGGATCGVRDGRLLASRAGERTGFGAIAEMPLSLGGSALYNVANAAAATLAALALRVPEDAIRRTLSSFGNALNDNPGRLQTWQFGDARVVVDYAHNPEGLHGLLRAVGAQSRRGRLSVLLGHAGNREDDDLRAVAGTVAQYRPERVMLKDIHGYERGRAPGEVAAIMRQALLDGGLDTATIDTRLDEVDAAHALLRELRPGDLLVLPLHETAARDTVVHALETMRAGQWRPGDALPERADRTHDESETA